MENEITGIYPIILDGVPAGEITVAREGLFWIFDAKCEMKDEIVRLSVFGEGLEGYLGVMEPNGDLLTLTKKLSRTAVNSFPQVITHGGYKGNTDYNISNITENSEEHFFVNESDNVSPPEVNLASNDVDYSPLEESIPPPVRLNSPHFGLPHDLIWHPCPCPCSLFSGIKEKMICSYISSAFAAQYGDYLYLAVPENIIFEIPNADVFKFLYKIKINDEFFLVCLIKQGKSISEL